MSNIPELHEGEIYAGIILDKNEQPDHHLILLPGQAISITFQQAQNFAAKAGGELPTRHEQSLLYANLKEEFEQRWYWSGERLSTYADYAWCRYFYYGTQIFDIKNQVFDTKHTKLRARAIRRVAI